MTGWAVLLLAACGPEAPPRDGAPDGAPDGDDPPAISATSSSTAKEALLEEIAAALDGVARPDALPAEIERAIEPVDRGIDPRSGLEGFRRRQLRYTKAQLLLRLGRFEEAAAEQLRLADEENDPAMRIVSKTEAATSLVDAKKPDAAIEILEAALPAARDVPVERRWPGEMLLARTLVAVGRVDEGFARYRSFVGSLGDVGMARDARYYWGDQLVAHGRLEEAIEVWRAAWPEHRSEPIVQRIGLRLAAALAETGGGDEADEILAWIKRRGDSAAVRAEAASDRRVLPLVGAAAPGLEAVSTEGAAFATLVAGATILFWDPAAPESIDGPFGLDRLVEAAAAHGQKVIAVALTKDEAAAKERAAALGPSVVLVVAEPALARGWELDRVPRTFRTDDGGRVVSYAITPARLVAGR